MRLQGETGTLGPKSDEVLIQSIERIRTGLAISWKEWADIVQMTKIDYIRVVQSKTQLTAATLLAVSEHFSINPSSLASGHLDISSLAHARTGNFNYINPIYTTAASSKKFTVVNTLNFVSQHRGTHLRHVVNRHFQVHEDFWADWRCENSQPINILFLTELWQQLKLFGLTEADFRHIGFHTRLTLRDTPIGTELSTSKSQTSAYEYFINEITRKIERNYNYSIEKLDGDRCVILSHFNPEILAKLERSKIGSTENCHVKIGIIASVPTFIGELPASVHETHCVHQGDPHCRFLVDFSKPNNSDKSNRPSRLTPLT